MSSFNNSFEDRRDLEDYLIEESEGIYSREELERLSSYKLFTTWLAWEGIIGWTDNILSACKVLGLPD